MVGNPDACCGWCTGVWASLATHTGDAAVVREFSGRAQEALERLFPEAAAAPA